MDFKASKTILGPSYFRFFKYKTDYYALVSGTFYKSKDGIQPFKEGALVLPKIRHSSVTVDQNKLVIFYSQKGDAPERILKCEVDLSNGNWKQWKATSPQEVLKPLKDYEGVDLPITKSLNGFARQAVHQLRDPYIFLDNKEVYLFYAVAGESGIAVANLL